MNKGIATIQVKIGYGPIMPTLSEQLSEQGLTLKDADRFEKQRNSVNVLSVSGLLTDSETDKCLARLHKRVMENLGEIHTI